MFALSILEIIVAIILILPTSFFAYWIYLNTSNHWLNKKIPFEKPYPFLGIFSDLLRGKSFHETDQNLYKKHGRLFGAYAGMKPCLYVSDPDLVKLILVKDFDVFPNRRKFNTGSMMDNMVVLLDGDDKWRNIRNTMTPAFSSGKIKAMIPAISNCANISTNNFIKAAKEGKPIECKDLYRCFTLDVIANIAFGTKLDSHNDPNNEFLQHARKFVSSGTTVLQSIAFMFPKAAKLFGVSLFPLESLDFFRNVMKSIMERREANNEVRPDFLQLMLDSRKGNQQFTENDADQEKSVIESVDQIKRKPLTEEEALAQCVLFFIAGLENIALTLNLTSHLLATNPDVQEKLLQEVDRIWEKRKTFDAEAMHEAKYMDAVIDETLRLYPAGVRIERENINDYELGDTGIQLKKGMHVEIPVFAIHHDPEFYPEPEKFKPERFLPKEDNEIVPYTYLPFGAGPRNCVAMRFALIETKICLLHILRSVKFVSCAETKIPMEFFGGSPNLVPKDNFLKVTLRS